METKSVIEQFTAYIMLNRGLSARTATEYRKDLREIQKWLRQQAKVERWSQVEKDTIDEMVADWVTEGLHPATIRRRISCLRSFYQWAWVKGLQKENPAKYVSTPKLGQQTPKTLPTSVIAAAISDARTDRQTAALMTIMSETGTRIAEALNIRRADIDEETKQITVIGKGNKERRVYYGQGTTNVLSTLPSVGNGQLFTLGYRDARRRIHEALRRHTAAEHASSHTLRHTWATSMLNAGCDLKTISFLMGHASVKTTERYAQVAGAMTAAHYKLYHTDYGTRKEETKVRTKGENAQRVSAW